MSEEAIRSVCGPKLLVRYEELSLKTVPHRNAEIRIVNARFKRRISHVPNSFLKRKSIVLTFFFSLLHELHICIRFHPHEMRSGL